MTPNAILKTQEIRTVNPNVFEPSIQFNISIASRSTKVICLSSSAISTDLGFCTTGYSSPDPRDLQLY